jgi:DNA polymerase IIIc chi subunit
LDTLFEEPVVITSEIETAADYNILLMYDPAPLEVLSKFDQVIDFAEKYDLTALQKSRKRYQMYQEKKWPVETVKPGEFLLLNLKPV